MTWPIVMTTAYWMVKTVAVRTTSSVNSLVKLASPFGSNPRIGLPLKKA